MKIVSIDKVNLLTEHIEELKKHGEVVLFDTTPNSLEEVKERISDADIVLDNVFNMDKAVLNCCSNLKLICVFGTGYNFVDLTTATAKDILVSNAPGYATESTAEHTFGLILNAIRLGSRAERDLRNGVWNPHTYKGIELRNKTLGIVGYGNIGKRVADIAIKAFDMNVLYTNTQSSRDDFEKLLRESDVISINAPLNDETKSMLSVKEFELMKTGVVIVNTGRGAILDTLALVDSLRSGKVFSAGLDVFEEEPIPSDSPLLTLDNITLTPHMGFKTADAEFNVSKLVASNVTNFLSGNATNIVNLK